MYLGSGYLITWLKKSTTIRNPRILYTYMLYNILVTENWTLIELISSSLVILYNDFLVLLSVLVYDNCDF